jgi:hypothetical protein
MNLVYKGDTFMKETEDKKILRVEKKEYRFEKTKVDLDRCRKIIQYFSTPQSTEGIVGSQDKEDLKTMYLLIKLKALVEIPEDFVMSSVNMYILRNYIDYDHVIAKLKSAPSKPIWFVDSLEALDNLQYDADSYIITSIFEENIISLIDSKKNFENLLKDLNKKKTRKESNPKIQKLLSKYVDILAIDQLSSYSKYENTFVFTSDLQVINYAPFDLEKFETESILMDETNTEEENISNLLDYFQRHPSFFLTYFVEKDRLGDYIGNAYLRGYNVPKQEFQGPDYLTVLVRILHNIFPDGNPLSKYTKHLLQEIGV